MTRDNFRKPYNDTENNDYADLMRNVPFAATPESRSKPHSEFLKPYADELEGYGEMEDLHPRNFSTQRQPLNVDIGLGLPSIGDTGGGLAGITCICFHIEVIGPKVANNNDCYQAILWRTNISDCGGNLASGAGAYENLGMIDNDLVEWSVKAPSGCTEQSAFINNKGCLGGLTADICNLVVNAKTPCVGGERYLNDLMNVKNANANSACGCAAIWENAEVSGPEAPADGDYYNLMLGGVAVDMAGLDTLWVISKGSIGQDGRVSGLAGQCGTAVISAIVDCECQSFTFTKTVAMPLGIWVCQSISYVCPEGALTCSTPGLGYGSGVWTCGFNDPATGQCTNCDGMNPDGLVVMHRNNSVDSSDPCCDKGASCSVAAAGCLTETATVVWAKTC